MSALTQTHPYRLESSEKHAEVFRLRLAGHDYASICEKLGYAGGGSVHYALMAELDRRVGKPCEQYRQLELARIDAIWQPLYERFVRQAADLEGEIDLELVTKLLKISDHRCRLLGLTTKLHVHLPPDGDESEAPTPKTSPADQVAALLDKLRARAAQQAKPLDVIDEVKPETNGHQP